MPDICFPFEVGGPVRLRATWKGKFQNMTVSVDGKRIGNFRDQQALAAGQEFKLTDGSTLIMKLVNNNGRNVVQIRRDGTLLPNAVPDPEKPIKDAANIIYLIAGINILGGSLSLMPDNDFLQEIGFGWYSIVLGIFFLVMGFLVDRHSKIGLLLAISVFVLNSMVVLIVALIVGNTASLGLAGIVILILPMIKGVKAITEIKKSAAK